MSTCFEKITLYLDANPTREFTAGELLRILDNHNEAVVYNALRRLSKIEGYSVRFERRISPGPGRRLRALYSVYREE